MIKSIKHFKRFPHTNTIREQSDKTLLNTTILPDKNSSVVFCFLLCVNVCVCMHVCRTQPGSQALINYTDPLRSWGWHMFLHWCESWLCARERVCVFYTRCIGVRLVRDLMCVSATVQLQQPAVANNVSMLHVELLQLLCALLCIYKWTARSSLCCVCVCGWVMNRRFRCSARNALLSAAGASWHRQGTRCQSSAGTCSVDQWHFFFFFFFFRAENWICASRNKLSTGLIHY